MEAEKLKAQSAFITHETLARSQDELRREMSAKIDKTNDKVDDVEDKVDNLRDMVLPLLETSKQTAENTRKMAESMDRFTESQRATNGKIYDKLSGHEVSIEGLKLTAGANAEKKMGNVKIIVSVLGLVGIVVSGLFALAPLFFN